MKEGAGSASTLASFFSGTTVWIVAIVLVVLLAVGIGVSLWYRKKKTTAAAPVKPAVQEPSVPKGELADLWKSFLGKLPEAVRAYPVVIVLGDAGSGKSTLIENRVDSKGQAAKFLPSEKNKTKVDFYVGEDVLVQEISATLLWDTSQETKDALTELWRHLGSQRPSIVVVVKPNAALESTPDAVKELGQLIRGKIDLLSGLRNDALLRARLCLTFMDSVAGFTELASVVRARGKTDPLILGTDTSGAGLARSLTPLEGELTYSLTSQPVDEFKAVVRFFGGMRRIFDAVSPLASAVTRADGLTTAPLLDRLYLSGSAPADHVGDPFTIDRRQLDADVQRAESNLRTYCLAALVFAGVVTAGLYGYQGYELRQARAAVERFVKTASGSPTTASAADLDAAERAAGESLARLARAEKLPLFKYSFSEDKARIRTSFTDAVRTTYLFPLLDRRLDASRLAYAVGLVYAAEGNDLGNLVEKDPGLFARTLGVPDTLPADYVGASVSAYPQVVSAIPSTNNTVPAAATDLKVWYTYLTRLDGAFRGEDISTTELASLQADAGPLVEVLRHAQSYRTTKSIVDILSRDKRLDTATMFGSLGTDSTTPTWVSQNQDTLSGVLTLVLTSRLPAVQVDSLSLAQVLTLLAPAPSPALPPAGSASASASAAPAASASASASAAPAASGSASASASASSTVAPSPTYTLVLSETTFVFGTSAWSDLLLRSRMAQIVVSFIDSNRRSGKYPFFAGDPSTYLSVGAAAVPGKGPSRSIAGIFTKTAFDAEVKPVLLTFDSSVSATALGASRKRMLTDYVGSESSRYASAYGSELKSYFASYEWSASTPEALAFDIGQLAVPGSWLASFLGTIATNAGLDASTGNPYLQPLATTLTAFKPIVTANAQLDKYASILAKMLPPAPVAPPPGQPAALTDKLSSTGLAALSMIKKEPTSGYLQVQPWLESAGLDSTWSRPFLQPVDAAYSFGVANINQVVADAWQKEVNPDVQPLLAQFPFDPKATVEASASDMEARIGQKGTFWSDFTRLIAPVCLVSNGVYVPLSSALRFPSGMLDRTNALLGTQAALWDKGGKPQALSLGIRALPFPAPKSGDPAIILAQLQTGEISVFGFNQTPAFQSLPLAWSKQGTSSINVQVSSQSGSTASSQTQSTPPATSAWSFYRLLQQADPPQQLVWKWHLPLSSTGTQTSPVSFAMTSDPWAPFVVPASP